MAKQERAVRTRQSLIQSAAEVFAREGYAAASLAHISRLTGVSNGALHFHFETKRELARAVEEEAARRLRTITEDAPVDGARGSALQGLVAATHGLMSRLAEDVVVRAGFELGGEPALGATAGVRRYWQEWVEDMLERADREGVLADGVTPERVAPAIVAATVGFEVLGGRDRGWLSGQRIDAFWELVLPQLTGEAV
ncbi:TetR family transcriptional regulator [Streptomyces longisporoflavus]|uniref:ScbR family autoregulator-binding transcription factor n=1 Tax=Streptomyces longisporoflavus TaxID=28044 RepID=UPI00167EBA94|nr:ScbR family autoregulator-binding transcription factor [Streptomyces longisporoflavus]GGV66889.1 TetR family transcriptional regulator [Streptomyces longisporoflavus]